MKVQSNIMYDNLLETMQYTTPKTKRDTYGVNIKTKTGFQRKKCDGIAWVYRAYFKFRYILTFLSFYTSSKSA